MSHASAPSMDALDPLLWAFLDPDGTDTPEETEKDLTPHWQEPGTVLKLDLDVIPENKRDDFSMHQVPTSNLLRELRDSCGVEVVLIVCQPAEIPEEARSGLSEIAQGAVARAAEAVLRECALERVTS